MKRICTATIFMGLAVAAIYGIAVLALLLSNIAPDLPIHVPHGWLKWPWWTISIFCWGFSLYRIWGFAGRICAALRNWADRQAGGL